MPTHEQSGARPAALIALALAAFNLRTPLTSVPTVIADIRTATGLGDVALGALTTLPILAMGLLAVLVPAFAARFGATRAVWFGLMTLLVANALRLAAENLVVLTLSVLLAGVGIAIVGGLVPGIVKAQLPGRIGIVTGLWTSVMSGGAALGAAATVPIGTAFGSWQSGLAIWALPALLAVVVWGLVERPHRQPALPAARPAFADLPWRDRTAWWLTLFIAANSFAFYSGVAWLADSFSAHGMTQTASGLLLGLFTASGIVAAFIGPPLLQRARRRVLLLELAIGITALGLLGLAFAPMSLSPVWVIAFGGVNTGWFAMGLAMIGWLTPDGDAAARLTAMVYTVVYCVAALGPVLCGWLLHISGSWTLLYALLAAVCSLPAFAAPTLVRHMRTER